MNIIIFPLISLSPSGEKFNQKINSLCVFNFSIIMTLRLFVLAAIPLLFFIFAVYILCLYAYIYKVIWLGLILGVFYQSRSQNIYRASE